MHIPDGLLNVETSILMYIISISILVLSWKKAKNEYPKSLASLLAISSAFVFAAQMINFPIAYGTSGHLVGGTFLAVLLGPWAAILGMTIVLSMQALFFADGGLLAFGANVFNMAIIGGLSFFIVKLLARETWKGSRFYASIFVASWLSVVLGALACALEIGVSPAFLQAGGVSVTVPAMLFWHVFIGIGEAAITATLITSLHKINLNIPSNLKLLRRENHERTG
ncbi:MAG: energy-coupling factor ABC transporter permease [Candidatus Bathyarchaeia archaeon]